MNAAVTPSDYRSVTTILNSLDALVYVSDLETHEMIFMNRYGERHWGDWTGRRCWQVLQAGQSGPCAFCTNHRLLRPDGKPAEVLVWEFQNTVTGRWFQCRDQAIPWLDGRFVRIEIAVDITELKHLQADLKAAREQAERLARIDPLTTLRNRRAFFEDAGKLLRQAARYDKVFTVAMIDIDYFKRINDEHGHAVGDRVIQKVADLIQSCVRDVDVVARMGGEEFGVALFETSGDAAAFICERIRDTVERSAFHFESAALRVTCSIGFVDRAPHHFELEDLMGEADKALYRAKRAGRNRVERFPGEPR